MNYWLIVTSAENFCIDRDRHGFKTQGLKHRFRKQVQRMKPGDRVVYYIMKNQKFGATATITGEYYEDHSKLWTDDNEMWPSRCSSEPNYVLEDDELIDAKRLIPDLSFVENKAMWGIHFQGSIKTIPEEDFKLIESEIKKVIAERSQIDKVSEGPEKGLLKKPESEDDYIKLILSMNLQANSLHDRLGEMLEIIGSWMDYNTQTRHKITPDHAYELDVAWLSGRNPEIAIEIQIGGNLTEAKDRLAQARKFNYRKVILVLKESDLKRLNTLMRHEPELRSWMEAWSIGAVYDMYHAGEKFFSYYRRLRESIYKEKSELTLIE